MGKIGMKTFAVLLIAAGLLTGQSQPVAFTHVRVIDGTGAAPAENQTLIVRGDRIEAVGANVAIPAGAETIDLAGKTIIPGIVGMHEHLFYPTFRGQAIYSELPWSFPRLYLASGVTTARTGGTLEAETDLFVSKAIAEGKWVGPDLLVTAGYIEGKGAFTPQMLEMRDASDAVAFVDFYATMGANSFKAYMHVTRDMLKAAIDAAHRHGLKLTGHLCSVGFREAAAMGIDNLEHGIVEDGEFMAGKKPDECPTQTAADLEKLDMQSAEVQGTIKALVDAHVAVTSTLAVFESTPPIQQRFLDALAPQTALGYMSRREMLTEARKARSALEVRKEQEFERAFVKAGGLLMAGADPTGNGSALAGFGDQRNIELLVGAGFTAQEAIRIATLNGATFLGMDKEIGTVAPGKRADLVIIDGNPAAQITDIEKVQTVYKHGVRYDSAQLIESVKGAVGIN
jgi:imidazolonepropionase-like amidohydrolase